MEANSTRRLILFSERGPTMDFASTVARNLTLLLGLIAITHCGCGAGSRRLDAEDASPTASGSVGSRSVEKNTVDPGNQVVIENFSFSPRELIVKVGARVTWVNRDDVPHTATSNTKPKAFDSRTLDMDESFSFVFNQAGEFPYFCAVHPHMTGKIIVP
jgi:plastocyanin